MKTEYALEDLHEVIKAETHNHPIRILLDGLLSIFNLVIICFVLGAARNCRCTCSDPQYPHEFILHWSLVTLVRYLAQFGWFFIFFVNTSRVDVAFVVIESILLMSLVVSDFMFILLPLDNYLKVHRSNLFVRRYFSVICKGLYVVAVLCLVIFYIKFYASWYDHNQTGEFFILFGFFFHALIILTYIFLLLATLCKEGELKERSNRTLLISLCYLIGSSLLLFPFYFLPDIDWYIKLKTHMRIADTAFMLLLPILVFFFFDKVFAASIKKSFKCNCQPVTEVENCAKPPIPYIYYNHHRRRHYIHEYHHHYHSNTPNITTYDIDTGDYNTDDINTNDCETVNIDSIGVDCVDGLNTDSCNVDVGGDCSTSYDCGGNDYGSGDCGGDYGTSGDCGGGDYGTSGDCGCND